MFEKGQFNLGSFVTITLSIVVAGFIFGAIQKKVSTPATTTE